MVVWPSALVLLGLAAQPMSAAPTTCAKGGHGATGHGQPSCQQEADLSNLQHDGKQYASGGAGAITADTAATPGDPEAKEDELSLIAHGRVFAKKQSGLEVDDCTGNYFRWGFPYDECSPRHGPKVVCQNEMNFHIFGSKIPCICHEAEGPYAEKLGNPWRGSKNPKEGCCFGNEACCNELFEKYWCNDAPGLDKDKCCDKGLGEWTEPERCECMSDWTYHGAKKHGCDTTTEIDGHEGKWCYFDNRKARGNQEKCTSLGRPATKSTGHSDHHGSYFWAPCDCDDKEQCVTDTLKSVAIKNNAIAKDKTVRRVISQEADVCECESLWNYHGKTKFGCDISDEAWDHGKGKWCYLSNLIAGGSARKCRSDGRLAVKSTHYRDTYGPKYWVHCRCPTGEKCSFGAVEH